MALLVNRWIRRILIILACRLGYSSAEIYEFGEKKVQRSRSLETLYAFFVFSSKEAPGRHIGEPYVQFHQLNLSPPNTEGIEVSFIRYADFVELVDQKDFCTSPEDVVSGDAKEEGTFFVNAPAGKTLEDVDMYTAQIGLTPMNVQRDLASSGVYLLVITNCGESDDAILNGQVIVKNPNGFLPGIEYGKMPFYGWLCVLYSILSLIWLGLSVRWWKELFNIQKCIGGVLLLGIVESALWYGFLTSWNVTGKRGAVVFCFAIGSAVVKSCFSYMLVLVASLGWGITRPFLPSDTVPKIQALSLLYIVFDFVRQYIMSFKDSHTLSIVFTLTCVFPVALMNVIIFNWVFSALTTLLESLKERRQTDKLLLFQKLWHLLVASLCFATMAMLYQVFDILRGNISRWRYEWIFTDCLSHTIFVVVLLAMMYFWAPHQESKRYAYSQQLDTGLDGDSKGADVWADEDIFDGDNDDDVQAFWANTRNEVVEDGCTAPGWQPDVIGSAVSRSATAANGSQPQLFNIDDDPRPDSAPTFAGRSEEPIEDLL